MGADYDGCKWHSTTEIVIIHRSWPGKVNSSLPDSCYVTWHADREQFLDAFISSRKCLQWLWTQSINSSW